MFEAYSTATATFTQNQPITFENIRYKDCRVNETNSSTITITAPGRYYIFVGATGLSGAAGTAFSIQMFQNGVAIPAATAETSLATDTTMGLSTIINVLPSCCAINNTTNIQVIVTSAQSGILTDRNIVVFRLK